MDVEQIRDEIPEIQDAILEIDLANYLPRLFARGRRSRLKSRLAELESELSQRQRSNGPDEEPA